MDEITEKDIYDIYHNIVFRYHESDHIEKDSILEKELSDLNKLAENHNIKAIFCKEHIFGNDFSENSSSEDYYFETSEP